MKKILFVCTGNTCRSPMAEALCRKILALEGCDEEYVCTSAGVYAFEGDEASPEAIMALAAYELDLSGHYATVLTEALLKEAYIVLTMTREHKRMIDDVFPEAADKTFTLKEYADYDEKDWDIADPFGGSAEVYSACAAELEAVLYKMADKLIFD